MFKELLRKHGSQAEIARALGVSRMAVNKWFNGKTFPSRKTAERIANDLGVSLGEVYNQANKKQRTKKAKDEI